MAVVSPKPAVAMLEIEQLAAVYGAVSGYKLNTAKTQILCVNTGLYTDPRKSIFTFLAIASLVKLHDGVCHFKNNLGHTFEDYVPQGCIDAKGKPHAYYSKWLDDCHSCNCLEDGQIQCCSQFGMPSSFDEQLCITIFDPRLCKYVTVKKDDFAVNCDVHSYNG
ncbi:beta-microseminoprotein A1-like [Lissotriton helveticus]